MIRIRQVSVIAMMVASAFSVSAIAGHDAGRSIEFLGFSGKGHRYLMLVRDENVGDFLSVRSFSTGKQEKGFPIESVKDARPMVAKISKRYRISDPGKESATSPDGRFTLVAFQKGRRFRIKVMRGEKFADLHTITLDGEGTRLNMKTAFWSRDGHRVVVVVHKKGPEGVETDRAVPLKFFGGSLNFR
ncbi:MAG: hypothetical protein GXP54_03130 [Deltaproteobacteria bacterium]|nr:hypothetical protein [Deltaproteobacteria bacterium]